MNYKRRILTSILTLVLMIVALSTGVFAWFTVNTKTKATNLEGSAEALDGGFLISRTGLKDSFATSVSLADITLEGFKFTDVTTEDGIVMKDMEDDTVTSGFLEFDLYFLTGSERRDIYLTYLEIDDVTDGASWVAEKDIPYGNNLEILQGTIMKANLSSALRVSFQEENKNKANIFEKYGSSENIAVDDSNGTATFSNTTGFGGFAAKYYESIMDESLDIPNDRGDISLNENHTIDEQIGKSNQRIDGESLGVDTTFTHMTKVTVRVWLEGWDGEAFNAIHSGKVKLTFNFNVRNNDE